MRVHTCRSTGRYATHEHDAMHSGWACGDFIITSSLPTECIRIEKCAGLFFSYRGYRDNARMPVTRIRIIRTRARTYIPLSSLPPPLDEKQRERERERDSPRLAYTGHASSLLSAMDFKLCASHRRRSSKRWATYSARRGTKTTRERERVVAGLYTRWVERERERARVRGRGARRRSRSRVMVCRGRYRQRNAGIGEPVTMTTVTGEVLVRIRDHAYVTTR